MSRLIKCDRSGPNRPSATVPATAWQLMQAVVSKMCRPSEACLAQVRGLTLFLNPAIKLISRLNINSQQHLGVLRSAILGALPQVKPGLMRINPHAVRMVGNQVRFAIEARYPEAVIRIRRKQSDEGRSRMLRIADRNVQFIRSHDMQSRIAILPPKLMTDGDHFNRIARLRSLLDAANHPRRRHEQRHHDENRNDGPCQLYLIAAVNLWRLSTVIVRRLPESHDRIGQQAENDHKYRCRNRKHKYRQAKDCVGRRGSWRKNIRRAQRRVSSPSRRGCAEPTDNNKQFECPLTVHGLQPVLLFVTLV